MLELLELILTTSLWAAVVRIATPLIFATLGELICERAGVLNLGIEGIMTIGAMAGWLWVYQGGDLWGGVVFAAIVGMLFGFLHSILVVILVCHNMLVELESLCLPHLLVIMHIQ